MSRNYHILTLELFTINKADTSEVHTALSESSHLPSCILCGRLTKVIPNLLIKKLPFRSRGSFLRSFDLAVPKSINIYRSVFRKKREGKSASTFNCYKIV